MIWEAFKQITRFLIPGLKMEIMNDKSTQQFFKLVVGIALGGVILVLGFGVGSSISARAQEVWTETPTEVLVIAETPYGTPEPSSVATQTALSTITTTPIQGADPTSTPASNGSYTVESLSLSDGNVVDVMIIHGPPVPPPGYEIQRQSGGCTSGTDRCLTVPAYPWVFGCSAVSGAMVAGYYDRSGYPNIYTGPTNGGVMPLVDSGSWGSWGDNPPSPSGNFTFFNNPLVASRLGLDGRAIRGSIDDYWVQYGNSAPDPYITGGWSQHARGDAIGDYMQTSQSAYNLGDAYTRFFDNWSNPAAPLTCAYLQGAGYVDGTVGRKLFYEAKGYSVTDCYNQFTDNQYAGGFSFVQYKAEIDAGRPVMINLTGHTIVGVGYADPDTVYIHDTWDSGTHSMTWGGSYSGMAMVAVSIVNLAPSNYSVLNVSRTGLGTGTVTSSPAGINCGANCIYAYPKTTNVILTAVAASGSAFTGWSGGGCSGTGPCTVPMSTAQSVVAAFSPPDLAITRLGVLPLAPFTSDDITISVDVANLSAANASTFRIEFYVDDVWQGCWYLGTPPEYFTRVAGLAGNSSGTWSVTIPGGTLLAGTHTLSAYVDMGCELAESNEANNSAGPVSVTFTIPLGGAFNLSSPANTASNQLVNPTLLWGASSGADSYEYCLNTIASCVAPAAWTSTGAAKGVALGGLTPGTQYFWQVRARNSSGVTYANGDSSAWWSFMVLPPPGTFNKVSPVNNATKPPSSLTLAWTASANAGSYEYCVNTSPGCSVWISAGTNTSVALGGVTPGLYYWQVRARNSSGITYANGNNAPWFSFTVFQFGGQIFRFYLPLVPNGN